MTGRVRITADKINDLTRFFEDLFRLQVEEIPLGETGRFRPLLNIPDVFNLFLCCRCRQGIAEENGPGVGHGMLLAAEDPQRQIGKAFLQAGILLKQFHDTPGASPRWRSLCPRTGD